MQSRPNRTLLFLLILFFLSRCANVVTPAGGEKDILPPAPETFSPENYSVNFSEHSISIKFNEYVQLNDVFNQVLISPPVEEFPDFKLKGKTLLIHFKSDLKDSTTYTINFGQSIKDITEGNILENFTYVFSTGDVLDSLQVSGTITDLLTNSVSKSAYAVLYLNATDSSFIKNRPYYFAKADESGAFTIKNIRSGHYKLYAIEDQNFNYYYDLPNEKIAFQTGELNIDSNVTSQKLKLFPEDKLKQNITEAKSISYGVSRIAFTKPANDVVIQYTGEEPDNGFFIRNKTNDTLLFWHRNYKLPAHQFLISFDTSVITKVIETKTYPDDSVFHKQLNGFFTNLPKATAGKPSDWDIKKKIILQFNHPLATIDSNKIQISFDTLVDFPASLKIDSADSRKAILQYNWKENKEYDIFIPKNISKDIYGLTNDSITLKIKTRKLTDYATLTVKIKNVTGSGILFQLLSYDQATIFEERYLPSELFTNGEYSMVLTNLLPGIYKLKAVIDNDGNHKWTTGNMLQNKLPEPVYFFPVDQNLRSNWETTIEWLIE